MWLSDQLLKRKVRLTILLPTTIILFVANIAVIAVNDYASEGSDNYIINDGIYTVLIVATIVIWPAIEWVMIVAKWEDEAETIDGISGERVRPSSRYIIIINHILVYYDVVTIIKFVCLSIFLIVYEFTKNNTDYDLKNQRYTTGIICTLDLPIYVSLVMIFSVIGICINCCIDCYKAKCCVCCTERYTIETSNNTNDISDTSDTSDIENLN